MATAAKKMDESVFIDPGAALYTSGGLGRENVPTRTAMWFGRTTWRWSLAWSVFSKRQMQYLRLSARLHVLCRP